MPLDPYNDRFDVSRPSRGAGYIAACQFQEDQWFLHSYDRKAQVVPHVERRQKKQQSTRSDGQNGVLEAQREVRVLRGLRPEATVIRRRSHGPSPNCVHDCELSKAVLAHKFQPLTFNVKLLGC